MDKQTTNEAARKRPFIHSLIFFIPALLVPLLITIVDPGPGEAFVDVTPTHIEQVSGGFNWRFFQWHIFGGNGDVTKFDWFLMKTFHIHASAAQNIDAFVNVANPTPFLIFFLLVIITCVCLYVDRKKLIRKCRAGATAVGTASSHIRDISEKLASVVPKSTANLPESAPADQPLSEHEQLLAVTRALDQKQTEKSPKPNEPAA
jgi:hypothetical protein